MLIEILGWVGTVGVVVGYLLATRGIWPATGIRSAVLNATSSVLLIMNGWHHGAMPSVGLNVVWVLIALAAITTSRKQRTAPTAKPVPS